MWVTLKYANNILQTADYWRDQNEMMTVLGIAFSRSGIEISCGALALATYLISASAAAASDVQALGLKGNVQSVEQRQIGKLWTFVVTRIFDVNGDEVDTLSGGEKEGVLISHVRTIFGQASNGDKVSVTFWGDAVSDGYTLQSITVEKKDELQRVEATYDEKGLFKLLSITKHDQYGSWVEQVHYRSYSPTFARLRADHVRDADNVRTGTTIVSEDGSRSLETHHDNTYVETKWFAPDGNQKRKTTMKYDSHANLVEQINWDVGDQPSFRIEQTYEYDRVGNWISSRIKTLILDGKSTDEITEIRRKIKYF